MQIRHDKERISFASDNYSGAHPEILAALEAANGGHVGAYGADPYTEYLQVLFKRLFGKQATAWPVWNGTGANVLALQALLPRWGAAICAETAHINEDESTAPQAVGGFKLFPVAAPHGKLTPELVGREAWGYGFEHRAQPLAVSITQSTELGTCYTPSEIRALADCCHANNAALHMDGARLANAAATMGLPFRELTTDVGVDILSFGGTKNGLLFGECVVILNPERVSEGMKYLRKLNLQLASKMRFLSAQFIALLEDGLWLRSARHANEMAVTLAKGLQQIEGVTLMYPVQANSVFVRLPQGAAGIVRGHTFFYDWDQAGTVRFVCGFDTRPEDVEKLLQAVRGAVDMVKKAV
ncbi:MAG: low specificity L-threonine aldolase [Neisseria sp.]|nr:low specificity L-threonine aldolase [Neisseria sp.]